MSKRSRSRAESPELGSPPARNKSSGLRWPLIQKLISKAVAPCSSQRDADAAMDAVLAQVQLTRLTTLEASFARVPATTERDLDVSSLIGVPRQTTIAKAENNGVGGLWREWGGRVAGGGDERGS